MARIAGTAELPLLPDQAVRRAAASPRVLASIASLYEQVDRAVAGRSALCRGCGRCCDFGAFGHRLFVTTLEAAYLLAGVGPQGLQAPQADRCPYLHQTRCRLRQHRPVACRLFFCRDESAERNEPWMARLRDLHARLGVPYAYVDWIRCLRQLAASCEPGGICLRAKGLQLDSGRGQVNDSVKGERSSRAGQRTTALP